MGSFKVAYCDPARIHKGEHSFYMTGELKKEIAKVKSKKGKNEIVEREHRRKMNNVSAYIGRVIRKRGIAKDCIFAPYHFE